MKKIKIIIFAQIILIIFTIINMNSSLSAIQNIPFLEEDEVQDIGYTCLENYKTVKIKSEQDWLNVIQNLENGQSYKGYEVILEKDLNFEGIDIIPAGNDSTPFEGCFHGNNHTIYNVTIDSTDNRVVGFFGCIEDAVIKDLNTKNFEIVSDDAIGTGGIVGLSYYGRIINCTSEGSITGCQGSVGGIVGCNHGLVIYCRSYGKITGLDSYLSYGWYSKAKYKTGIGGVVGNNESIVESCTNYANLCSETDDEIAEDLELGGVVGCNDCIIFNCANYGKDTSGGIVATNKSYAVIEECFNFEESQAGIAYYALEDSYIYNCINFSTKDSYGIHKHFAHSNVSSPTGEIKNCLYSSGSIPTNSQSQNLKIHKLDLKEEKIIKEYIKNDQSKKAFNRVLENEINTSKKSGTTRVFFLFVIIVLLDSFYIIFENLKKNRIYKKAIDLFENNHFYEAHELFQQIRNYKDATDRDNISLNNCIEFSKKGNPMILGKIKNKYLKWILLKEDQGTLVFLSENVLFAKEIHSIFPISWKDSSLYHFFNNQYPKEIFETEILEYFDIQITLPTKEDVEICPKENRKCEPVDDFEILKNGDCAYWWILNKTEELTKLMVVTGHGLINDTGVYINNVKIGVRPIIVVRSKHENN